MVKDYDEFINDSNKVAIGHDMLNTEVENIAPGGVTACENL